jgi:hypothetical protein
MDILSQARKYLLPNPATLLAVALMLFVYRAFAAPGAPESPLGADYAPGVISYQGNLTNASGQPISASVDLTFRLYSAATGGSALWTEAHTGINAVPVQGGYFNVLLGSLSPIPSSVWSNAQLYLGIQAGSDAEMLPRQPVGAVPVALQAGTALSVPDAAVRSRNFAPTINRDTNPSILSTTSTTPITTNVSFSVSCDVNCTLLVLHRAMLAHSAQNGGVGVQVLVDGSVAFIETAVAAQAYAANDLTRWQAVSGFKYVDLTAGLHTVEVKYYCRTAGTCYYYGSNDGNELESLSAIVFAR